MRWPLDEPTVSLSGSTVVYSRGHIRIIGMRKARAQGQGSPTGGDGWEEILFPLSDKLVDWIKTLPHTCSSVAGTDTKYVPCLIRQEHGQAVRFQIPGPEFNRPWGAEFVWPHLGKHSSVAAPPAGPPSPLTSYKGTAVGASATSEPTSGFEPIDYTGGFKVGDEVKFIKSGDGDGCSPGPAVGTVGKIMKIHPNEPGYTEGCGVLVVRYGMHDDTWSTTPGHLALATVPVKPLLLAKFPGHWEKGSYSTDNLAIRCLTCGYRFGNHYGATGESAVCPPDKYPEKYSPKPPPVLPPLSVMQAAYLVKFGTYDLDELTKNETPCTECGQTWGKHANEACPIDPNGVTVPF